MNPAAEHARRPHIRGDIRTALTLATDRLAEASRAVEALAAAEFGLVICLIATVALDLATAERHLDRALASLHCDACDVADAVEAMGRRAALRRAELGDSNVRVASACRFSRRC
jgi:hypothetical protein